MGPSLKAVVFALPDDLNSLVLLEHIQEHLGERRNKVRFVVLMNELRWAEAFSMLDAVPLHEFVSSTQVTLFCLFACFHWPRQGVGPCIERARLCIDVMRCDLYERAGVVGAREGGREEGRERWREDLSEERDCGFQSRKHALVDMHVAWSGG